MVELLSDSDRFSTGYQNDVVAPIQAIHDDTDIEASLFRVALANALGTPNIHHGISIDALHTKIWLPVDRHHHEIHFILGTVSPDFSLQVVLPFEFQNSTDLLARAYTSQDLTTEVTNLVIWKCKVVALYRNKHKIKLNPKHVNGNSLTGKTTNTVCTDMINNYGLFGAAMCQSLAGSAELKSQSSKT